MFVDLNDSFLPLGEFSDFGLCLPVVDDLLDFWTSFLIHVGNLQTQVVEMLGEVVERLTWHRLSGKSYKVTYLWKIIQIMMIVWHDVDYDDTAHSLLIPLAVSKDQ